MSSVNTIRYSCDSDARMRLNGTIVRYNGLPVKLDVKTKDHAKAVPLDGHSPFIIDCNSPHLDISSVPLGMVDDGRRIDYIARRPFRCQRQGVHTGDLMVCSISSSKQDYNKSQAKALHDMIMDDYPGFDDCLDGGAFDRDWCVPYRTEGAVRQVVYRGSVVGFFDKTGGPITVVPPLTDFKTITKLSRLTNRLTVKYRSKQC